MKIFVWREVRAYNGFRSILNTFDSVEDAQKFVEAKKATNYTIENENGEVIQRGAK